MPAALRIIADVVFYRLRRLEMANLVAVVALMMALRLPLSEFVLRALFATFLNLLAYLNNDFCDVEQDLAAGRESEKAGFLAAHRGSALAVQIVITAALLSVSAVFHPGLAVAVLGGGGVCVLYSAWLKRVPFLDITAMAAWGVGMTLVAFPLDNAVGWALVGELGLFSAVFETIQVIRDHDADRASGVTTTAVRLGSRNTLVLARVLMLAAALYGVLVLHRYFGLVLLLSLAIPLKEEAAARYWNLVRLIFGVGFLGILGSVFWTGSTWGLLLAWGR